MEFPLDFARGCFPALADSESAYLDGASSPTLGVVSTIFDNGAFELVRETVLHETREALAFFLNSNEDWAEEEIVFAADGNELTARLAAALSRDFEPSAEVVCTQLDEESTIEPWLRRGQEHLKLWPVKGPRAELAIEELDGMLTERTRLVAVSKASSTVGTIVELLPVALRLREIAAELLVHWTPFIARGPVDTRFLRSDFVVASTEPLFGSRIAFLWGKRERMASLRTRAPELFDDLEPDTKSLASLQAALRYVEELGLLAEDMQLQPSEDFGRRRHMRRGMQAIRHYERVLTERALRRLAEISEVRVFGIRDPDAAALRTPDIYFDIKGVEPAELAETLAEDGIEVSHGACGAPRLLEALGLPGDRGAVRACLAHYNSDADVDRFADAVYRVARSA